MHVIIIMSGTSFRVNPHSIVCLNVNELFAWSRCQICKRKLNHLAKLANVFVYKLSSCGSKSHCCHLTLFGLIYIDFDITVKKCRFYKFHLGLIKSTEGELTTGKLLILTRRSLCFGWNILLLSNIFLNFQTQYITNIWKTKPETTFPLLVVQTIKLIKF